MLEGSLGFPPDRNSKSEPGHSEVGPAVVEVVLPAMRGSCPDSTAVEARFGAVALAGTNCRKGEPGLGVEAAVSNVVAGAAVVGFVEATEAVYHNVHPAVVEVCLRSARTVWEASVVAVVLAKKILEKAMLSASPERSVSISLAVEGPAVDHAE